MCARSRPLLAAAALAAAFRLTADHGMNANVRNWDLARVCREAGVPIRLAPSPERGSYVAHHRPRLHPATRGQCGAGYASPTDR